MNTDTFEKANELNKEIKEIICNLQKLRPDKDTSPLRKIEIVTRIGNHTRYLNISTNSKSVGFNDCNLSESENQLLKGMAEVFYSGVRNVFEEALKRKEKEFAKLQDNNID